jgi:TolC family type I secretion outer membrane protein
MVEGLKKLGGHALMPSGFCNIGVEVFCKTINHINPIRKGCDPMDTLFKRFRKCLLPLAVISLALVWYASAGAEEPPATGIDLEKIEVLDLKTAARIALEGNPSLAAAQARVGQAQEVVRQARASYWPRLDLNASRSRVDIADSSLTRQLGSSTSVNNPEDYYQASIDASWLIFDGFTRWFTLAAAKHGERSSEAARNDAQRLLLQAVSTAFLSAQLSLENVAIAKADEAFNQRQLTEARLRYQVGTGALSDVLNFEVKANSAQSDLIVAERTYETSRIGLAALLGVKSARLPEQTRLETLKEADAQELEAPQMGQLIESAYAHRPDLEQNEWGVRRAEDDVEARRGDYYPSFSLNASYNGERTDNFGFENEDMGSTVGINMSYNIFAGGLIRARHQEAKLRLHEVEQKHQDLKNNVTSEVRTTTERLLSAQKQLLLQRTNAQLVRRNRDLVEKEYKAGVGSLVRLNEAQRDLTAALVRLATAQVALRQAWNDLWSATGQIEAKLVP